MERNNIEGLFKGKLEGLVIEPSSGARERFAKKIQKRRRSVLVKRFSIAASILFFAFAGIYSYRILDTDKIDLSKREALDSGFEFEIGVLKNLPSPRAIASGHSEDPIPENTLAIRLRNSSTENPEPYANLAVKAQGYEDIEMDPETDMEGIAAADTEYDELIEGQEDESTYIEYFVADPELGVDQHAVEVSTVDKEREPLKITIEYIASGEKGKQSESKLSNFYSKLDNMKTMDEVLGDIRTYKDKLFALDFRKEEKVNNNEKSTE